MSKKNLSAYRVKKMPIMNCLKLDDKFIKETVIYCNKTSTKVKENKKLLNPKNEKTSKKFSKKIS